MDNYQEGGGVISLMGCYPNIFREMWIIYTHILRHMGINTNPMEYSGLEEGGGHFISRKSPRGKMRRLNKIQKIK